MWQTSEDVGVRNRVGFIEPIKLTFEKIDLGFVVGYHSLLEGPESAVDGSIVPVVLLIREFRPPSGDSIV